MCFEFTKNIYFLSETYDILTKWTSCYSRGPFITALGRTWCPSHFTCSQGTCQKSLQETGFVEEQGKWFLRKNSVLTLTQPFMLLSFAGHLYCEDCYGKYLAPDCEKCRKKILGVSLNVKMQDIFEPRIMDSKFTFLNIKWK